MLSTTFLKLVAGAGLTLLEIGNMMIHELCGLDEDASELEKVSIEAKSKVDKELVSSSPKSDGLVGSQDFSFGGDPSDNLQFDMHDMFEVSMLKLPNVHKRPSKSHTPGSRSMSLLPRSPPSPLHKELSPSPQTMTSGFRNLNIFPIPCFSLGIALEYS